MRTVRFFFACFFLSLGLLRGQSCTARATKTIQQAVQVASSGDLTKTRALLQEAADTCPASFPVMRDLARTYQLIGDSAKASEFEQRARDLDPRQKLIENQPLPDASKSFVREKWALLVGVSKFEHLSAQYQLSCPAKDAHDLARVLTDPQFGRFRADEMHVRVLTDADATLQNFRSAINYIAQNAREEDLVVLYVSSHGTSASQDVASATNGQTGYIVTYDTDPTDLYATAFPMEELRVVLGRIRAKRVVVFLDTCFSGGTLQWLKGSKALSVIADASYQRISQGTGRVIIVSSSGSQMSWEGKTNGYFTQCLMDAMKEKQGLGTVTELFTNLQRNLPYMVMKEKNANQTPMMWAQGESVDIVIGTPIQ